MTISIEPLLSYNPWFGQGVSRRPARRCASSVSAKNFVRRFVRGGTHSMIQNMPDGVDSKFRLVLLIARRAEQLMRGARPKLEADRPMKPTPAPAAPGMRIVLGVSGGIAAYKAAELCRGLVQGGFEVQAVLTRGAREFVSPLTFAVLSGRPVLTEVWGEAS